MKIEYYNMKEEETIELIAALLGGTQRDKKTMAHRMSLKKIGKNDAEDGRNNEVDEKKNGRHFWN